MGISRRTTLAAAVVAPLAGGVGGGARASAARRARFLGGANDSAGRSWLVGIDGDAEVVFRVPVPARAHHPVPVPGSDIVFVPARRPGDWMAVVDARDGRLIDMCSASDDRHFYGHAVLSPDGDRLFTTENDYRHARGMVVCRSVSTLTVLDEFPSGGIGPHQLAWLDTRLLAVANGGIRTHPSTPRKKLNLDAMRPNLTLIDSATGRQEAQAAPPHHQLSVRHLGVGHGVVVAGMQYEGPPTDDVPLLLAFDPAVGRLVPFDVPLALQRQMRQYTASVCVDPATRHAAVTCPRGNLVTFWDLETRRCAGSRRMRDTGGVALDGATHEFVVTSGAGDVFRLDAATFEFRREAMRRLPDLRWDNHVMAVSRDIRDNIAA